MIGSEELSEQEQFKHIISELFTDKFYDSLMDGSTLSVLQEMMTFAQELIETLEREEKSPSVACRKGCHYCCHSHLRITPAEALFISAFIDTHFGEAQRSGLKKK